MLKCLHSHIYKIVKSPLFYITILWPIICVGLFIAYYSVSSWSIEQNISGFFQALSLFMDCLVVMLCTGEWYNEFIHIVNDKPNDLLSLKL